MTDIAKHLATINCSASVFEGFPEVVVMHLTGKRWLMYFTYSWSFSIYTTDVCQCDNSFTTEGVHRRIIVANICFGISIPPCIFDDSDSDSKVKHISLHILVSRCQITFSAATKIKWQMEKAVWQHKTIHIYAYVYTYVCMYVHVYVVHVCVCMCLYVSVYVCVCDIHNYVMYVYFCTVQWTILQRRY